MLFISFDYFYSFFKLFWIAGVVTKTKLASKKNTFVQVNVGSFGGFFCLYFTHRSQVILLEAGIGNFEREISRRGCLDTFCFCCFGFCCLVKDGV